MSTALPNAPSASGPIDAADLEMAVKVAAQGRMAAAAGLAALLYIPVTLSHFVFVPEDGQWIMASFAVASAAVMGLVHWTLRRSADELSRWALVCTTAFYLAIFGHSLVRLVYCHEPGDLLFVAILTVALGFAPVRVWLHGVFIGAYVLGWGAVLTLTIDSAYGVAELAAPLLLSIAVSVAARYIESRRNRQAIALRLSEQRHAAALAESRNRFARAAAGANDGLFDWDLVRDEIYLSPRWRSMLGYEDDAAVGDRELWLSLVHPDDRESLEAALAAHVRGDTPHFEAEYRVRRADDTWSWMLCRGLCDRDARGTALTLAGSQTDITRRREALSRLEHQAFHDALTGLPNRAQFSATLEREFALARQHTNLDKGLAVLWLDLDRFKIVNDSLGHHYGDRLLVGIAKRLSHFVRPSDLVARLGGDEFAVLLTDLDPQRGRGDALAVVERLHAVFDEPFRLDDDHEVEVGASIGIAVYDRACPSAEALLRNADIAMYRAKSGGGGHQLFDEAMHAEAVERLQLEVDLRRALRQGGITVHYQPIVQAHPSGKAVVVALEALARFHHPSRGLLDAAAFLPVAIESGLVSDMGKVILAKLCEDLARWRRRGMSDLAVSYNVSTREFAQPDFEEQLARAASDNEIPLDRLWLELAEPAILGRDRSVVSAQLNRLRNSGLRICVDNFGVGYASLGFLQQLPFDVLKLDGSLLDRKDDEQKNPEGVLAAMLQLAEGLSMDVVVCGIESSEHMDRVGSVGFSGQQMLQGRHIAAPSPADEIIELVSRLGGVGQSPQTLH